MHAVFGSNTAEAVRAHVRDVNGAAPITERLESQLLPEDYKDFEHPVDIEQVGVTRFRQPISIQVFVLCISYFIKHNGALSKTKVFESISI